MFESLSERIHQDEMHEEAPKDRMTRYAMIICAAVGVVVALTAATELIK